MLAQLPEFQHMALMPRILRRSLKLEDYHRHRLSCHSHSNIRHGATLGGHWVLYLVSACSVELTVLLCSAACRKERRWELWLAKTLCKSYLGAIPDDMGENNIYLSSL